jgi:DNA-binding transcriptional MerR regulator
VPRESSEPSSSVGLRRRLNNAGVTGVSAHQIERWHKAGLLPSPRHRGLGRGRGSVSAYPAGTVSQVRVILRLLERHRNLEKVAVLLKLHGYEVSTRACSRAIERLALNPIDDLDPHRLRNTTSPQRAAGAAAEQKVRKRRRSDEGRAERRRDLDWAGSRAELIARLAITLQPLFGGLDRAAMLELAYQLGVGEIARKLNRAAPGLGEAMAQEAEAGNLEIDWARRALSQLTAQDFDTFVRACRVLLASVEALGLELTPHEPFAADCLNALRRPERRRKPSASEAGIPEVDAETAALEFFAKRQRERSRSIKKSARPGQSPRAPSAGDA